MVHFSKCLDKFGSNCGSLQNRYSHWMCYWEMQHQRRSAFSRFGITTTTHDIWSWWRHQMETFSALMAICANSPHKGRWRGALVFALSCAWRNVWVNNQWRGALIFAFIFAWINDIVNNHEVGDLRRHRAHYDVIVMELHKNTVMTK